MNTQDKIKELIEKYKKAQKEAVGCHNWHVMGVMITDLESLLEPECEHEDTTVRGNGQGGINKRCNECDALIESIVRTDNTNCKQTQ